MRALLDDLFGAFALLTRLPLPRRGGTHDNPPRGVWAYPLVGACVGALSALAWFAGQLAGLGPALSAGLALAAQVLITGAMHEDGLADVADGFGGGRDKYSVLSIMRDSRTGAFGVVALMLALGLRWGAIAALPLSAILAGLICTAMMGRLAMVTLLALLAPARSGGLGARVANPPRASVAAAFAISAVLLILHLPPVTALLAFAVMATAIAWLAWKAKRRIGGYTGDVLGAGEQLAQTAVLLLLAATS